MAKFKFVPTVPTGEVVTARIGAKSSDYKVIDKDKDKFVKLAADSQYSLCAAGNAIEGVLIAVEPATRDGFVIGSVQKGGRVEAVCDGSQADGTGSIAVGDLVVCGTAVASGTALTAAPKVRKATSQTAALHNWRVVSLGVDGAVGDTCVIEKV
jgi:hypothetical protein